MEKRIYFHDTDCGGIVYYANYLKYLEEARAEFFRARGLDLGELAGRGFMFVVARVEVDYRASARYGDLVAVETDPPLLKLSSLAFSQRVLRAGRLLVEARTIVVCVNETRRPRRIPAAIREVLSRPPGGNPDR